MCEENRQAPQPDCEKCHGSGVRTVPYINPTKPNGLSERTHEARCLCTYPALWKHRELVRDIFGKLAKEARHPTTDNAGGQS